MQGSLHRPAAAGTAVPAASAACADGDLVVIAALVAGPLAVAGYFEDGAVLHDAAAPVAI